MKPVLLAFACSLAFWGCTKRDTIETEENAMLDLPYAVEFSDFKYESEKRYFSVDKLTFYCLDGIDYEIPWIIWFDCFNTEYAKKAESYSYNFLNTSFELGGRNNTLIADISNFSGITKITVSIKDFRASNQSGLDESGKISLCDDNGQIQSQLIPDSFTNGEINVNVARKKVKHINISAVFGAKITKLAFE